MASTRVAIGGLSSSRGATARNRKRSSFTQKVSDVFTNRLQLCRHGSKLSTASASRKSLLMSRIRSCVARTRQWYRPRQVRWRHCSSATSTLHYLDLAPLPRTKLSPNPNSRQLFRLDVLRKRSFTRTSQAVSCLNNFPAASRM